MTLLFSGLWVTRLSGMGFDYMTIVPLLLLHCGFFFVSLMWNIFFGMVQSFLPMMVQQLVVILVHL